MDRSDQQGQQPTPSAPTLLDQYAAASQQCRTTAQQIGLGYDEHPQWRAAERQAEHLWKQALAVGHTRDELLAAGRRKSGRS